MKVIVGHIWLLEVQLDEPQSNTLQALVRGMLPQPMCLGYQSPTWRRGAVPEAVCCAAVQPVMQAPGPAPQPADPPSPAAAASQRLPSAGVAGTISVAAIAAMMGSQASADPAAVQPVQPAEQQQPLPLAALRPMSAAGFGVEVRSCCCLPSFQVTAHCTEAHVGCYLWHTGGATACNRLLYWSLQLALDDDACLLIWLPLLVHHDCLRLTGACAAAGCCSWKPTCTHTGHCQERERLSRQ